MVGSLAEMEQSSEKFTEKVFWRCRCLRTAEDFKATRDDGFDGQNKTAIKWFVKIENMAKP